MDDTKVKSALEFAKNLEADAVKSLVDLVRIPSENPPGECRAVGEAYAALLGELGYEVEVIPVPETMVRAEGLEGDRVNVIGRMRGSRPGRTLILNGHLDTVPAGDPDLWTDPPFAGVVSGGRVWGRGSSDSKGRMVAYAMSGVLLKSLGDFAGELIVTATADAEIGGRLGAGFLVEQVGLRADAAIVEGYNESVVRAASGLLWLEITTRGLASHGSIPHRGKNAIGMATRLVAALEDLATELQSEPSGIPGIPHTTVNVGTISGGTKTNVVPDTCSVTVDFRVMPEADNDALLRRVRSLLADLAAKDPDFDADIRVIRNVPSHSCPPDAPIITSLQRASMAARGKRLEVMGEPGGTDARWFNPVGVNAVNYGPGHLEEGRFHGVDENMEIWRLTEALAVLALAASDFFDRD